MTPISAYVLTHNSAAHLDSILAALQSVADEVLIVDSGSTDTTLDIAAQRGVRVLQRPLDSFRVQREFAQAACSHRYVFFCDSDEMPDQTLLASIRQAATQGLSAAAYDLLREWHVLGQRVRVIYPVRCPDRLPRLIDRERCRWDAGKQVHETLLVDGPRVLLDGRLHHHTFRTRAELARKLEGYTDLAAQQMLARYQQAGRRLDWRLRCKHALAGWISSPLGAFVKSYLIRGGIWDGRVGWTLMRYALRYSALKHRKLLRLARMRADNPLPAAD